MLCVYIIALLDRLVSWASTFCYIASFVSFLFPSFIFNHLLMSPWIHQIAFYHLHCSGRASHVYSNINHLKRHVCASSSVCLILSLTASDLHTHWTCSSLSLHLPFIFTAPATHPHWICFSSSLYPPLYYHITGDSESTVAYLNHSNGLVQSSNYLL